MMFLANKSNTMLNSTNIDFKIYDHIDIAVNDLENIGYYKELNKYHRKLEDLQEVLPEDAETSAKESAKEVIEIVMAIAAISLAGFIIYKLVQCCNNIKQNSNIVATIAGTEAVSRIAKSVTCVSISKEYDTKYESYKKYQDDNLYHNTIVEDYLELELIDVNGVTKMDSIFDYIALQS